MAAPKETKASLHHLPQSPSPQAWPAQLCWPSACLLFQPTSALPHTLPSGQAQLLWLPSWPPASRPQALAHASPLAWDTPHPPVHLDTLQRLKAACSSLVGWPPDPTLTPSPASSRPTPLPLFLTPLPSLSLLQFLTPASCPARLRLPRAQM